MLFHLLVDLLDLESSLLSGYSIVVSDNINVKGFNTSLGTKSLENYKPSEDAEVINLLRKEGGKIIGTFDLIKFIGVFFHLLFNIFKCIADFVKHLTDSQHRKGKYPRAWIWCHK